MPKLPCPPDLWPEFSKLLCAVLELPPEQRAHWLDTLPPQHAALHASLAKVVAHASILDGTPFLNAPHSPEANASQWRAGQCVGPYSLERELGSGGMAEVWLAVRSDGTLGRHVALKLPHAHLLAGALRQRFERERDILAGLAHPHITPLYDAGVSETGHPYLAMEWIDGVPITSYCRERNLALSRRLELFEQVLDAVSYAHVRLIAHRDLKPSNILVTGAGQVKLLDFGIAKLLGGETSGIATQLTQLGGRAITPDYAAPEQIAGQPITTAVDIFALGVVLFELLTGARPFDTSRRPRTAASEVLPASKAVTEENAQHIGALSAKRLRDSLQGDLDAIVAKALETNPDSRYGSAEAFADDLRRYQGHKPIAARRLGRLALMKRLVRRNRLAAALTAGLVLILLAGGAAVGWQSVNARRAAERAVREARIARSEAQRAESEARRQKATKDFLLGVFKASDPRIASDRPRGTITAKELLDASSDKIEKEFANDPQTQVELLGMVADIYGELDENERFGILNQKQIDLAVREYGSSSRVVIEARLKQADDANTRGDYVAALKQVDEIDQLIKGAGLDNSAESAYSLFIRAIALTPDASAQSERLRLLERASTTYAGAAPNDPRYSFVLSSIGGIYHGRSDYSRAADYTRRSIAVAEGTSGRDDGALALNYSNLGKSLSYDGRFDDAVQAYEHATQLAKDTYGIHSAYYWTVAGNYAQTLHLRGDREPSMQMFAALMPLLPSVTTKYRNAFEQNSAARVRETYGRCLLAEGRAKPALPEFEAAAQGYREAPTYFYDLAETQAELGAANDRLGRTMDARRLLKIGLDEYVKNFPADNPAVLRTRFIWGTFLLEHSDRAGAEEQFREILRQSHDRTIAPVALAHGGLARIALARHDTATALAFSSHAVDLFDHVTGPRDVRMGPKLWRIRAEALMMSGDVQGAISWAQRAHDADRQYDHPSSPDIAEAERTLSAAKAADTSSGTQSQ